MGGYRACPREALEIGGKQVLVRTKNPGAVYPSFQVLGPDREPIVLHGQWDDRYNFQGYAVFEMRRFEDMCRRGNKVLVSVGAQGFVGLISDWKFTYRRAWDIGYSFTLSIHSREDDSTFEPGLPHQVQDPVTIAAGLDQQGDYVAAIHERRPEASMYAKVMSAIHTTLDDVSVGLSSIRDALDTALSPLRDFKALATKMRFVEAQCSLTLDALEGAGYDATDMMTFHTARATLDFEWWSKSMAARLRIMRQKSRQGAVACDQRVIPPTRGTYRPRKGQSLYSVSQAVYGTPFGWRLIYQANRLSSITLTGTETLIIPARGSA